MIFKKLIYYIIILSICTTGLVFGQSNTSARIDNIEFELINNKLIINYDIITYNKNEEFYVWIEIYNSEDYQFMPHSISGDVNRIVKNGLNKTIIWNIYKDRPDFNDEIYVKVFASKYDRPAKLLMLSAFCPGLGNYKIEKNNTYFALCGLAYSSLISSITMEYIAKSTYIDYQNERNRNLRDEKLDKAQNQRKISNALLGITAGVWLGSLSYTIWQKTNYDKNLKHAYYPKISIKYTYDKCINEVPLLCATFKF